MKPARTIAANKRAALNPARVGIFLASCDRTRDIARHFTAAFAKYWPDCPFQVFCGANTWRGETEESGRFPPRAQPLLAPASNWRDETLLQLQQLRQRAPEITHVLVLLDDFILSQPVSNRIVAPLLLQTAERGFAYLRLTPIEEGLIPRFWQWYFDFDNTPQGTLPLKQIRRSHPYYSSLQVALWKLDYFEQCLRSARDIWHFENQVPDGVKHYSVKRPLLSYRHIVEKGQWTLGARGHCLKTIGFFEPGERAFERLSFLTRANHRFKRALFVIFGYGPMRAKRLFMRLIARKATKK